MDEQKTSLLRYQPTHVIDNNPGRRWWTNGREILELFWNSPANIVREKCLQTLEAMDGISSADLRWLEERVPIIFSNDNQLDYGERLLSLCLFKSGIRVDRERALALAIALFLKTAQGIGGIGFYSGPRARKLSKMIAGVIRKYPELYWASTVPEFLEASLACLHDDGVMGERALELICAADDLSFLPLVWELSRKAQKEKEEKEDFATKASGERFASAKARGVLDEVERHLLICKTVEEGCGIGAFKLSFTKAIGERAGQDPPGMRISLNYAKSGGLESISVSLYPITAQARDLLEKCEISICAQGIEVANAERELSHTEGYGQYKYPQYRTKFSFSHDLFSADCTLAVKQIRKTARLNISVNLLDQGVHQLGRWVHYLYHEG